MKTFNVTRTQFAQELRRQRRKPRMLRSPRVFNADCLYQSLIHFDIAREGSISFLLQLDLNQPNHRK